MSLSKTTTSPKVLVGLVTRKLEDIEAKDRDVDLKTLEQKIISRSLSKAQAKAKEVLAKALQEAEEIKKQAYAQGYAQGQEEAKQSLEHVKRDLSKQVQTFLQALSAEKQNILESYKQDLVALLVKSVEKVVGYQLEKNSHQLIQALLEEAIFLLEEKEGELVIKVNPQDETNLNQILANLKDSFLEKCKIKPDPKVPPLEVQVQAGNSLVKNNLEDRLKKVEQLLRQVSLD